MKKKLSRKFFTRDAIIVAKELLGKYLIHNYRDVKLSGKIVETEVYTGPEDKASHGYQNKMTERNKAEFYVGGHIYIYLVYGIYWQLNITTGKAGVPECVLIRALEPKNGIEIMKKYRREENIKNLTSGPGKLCNAMRLDRSCYGLDICKSKEIYIEDRGEKVREEDIVSAKRIGIDYAGEWRDRLLRFYIKDNIFVSKR